MSLRLVFETKNGSEFELVGTGILGGESVVYISSNDGEEVTLTRDEVREFREWLVWVEEKIPRRKGACNDGASVCARTV